MIRFEILVVDACLTAKKVENKNGQSIKQNMFTRLKFSVCTLLDHCLKKYTTLWNIWTYQLLCKKKLHNLL